MVMYLDLWVHLVLFLKHRVIACMEAMSFACEKTYLDSQEDVSTICKTQFGHYWHE